MSLCYATSDRGGCHMRGYTIGDEVLTGTLAPDTLQGKAEKIIGSAPPAGFGGEDFQSLKFSLILCEFWAVTFEQLRILFKHLWGRDISDEEFANLGARVWNLGRLFNLREGVEPDDLPIRLHAGGHAHTDGASAGRAIGTDTFKAALQEFYHLRGWDDHGVPTEAKLTELGVDVRL